MEGYSNSKQFNLNNKQRKMKKVIAIFAIAALTACGGKGTTEGTTDSTAVVLDSTAVSATDSTVAEIKADSVVVK